MTKHVTAVSNFRDLAQFGITGLTGEACAHGMRTLCDVNEDGKTLLSNFFGISELVLNANWNQTVNDKPAIGSIMLTADQVPKLAQFAFFQQGALAVVIVSGNTYVNSVNGIFDEKRIQEYRAFIDSQTERSHSLVTNHALSSQAPRDGSRNVHAASGRAH